MSRLQSSQSQQTDYGPVPYGQHSPFCAMLHHMPGYHDWHERAVCMQEPLSVDDGTITRSYKPRRDAIFAKYSTEISQLQALLR